MFEQLIRPFRTVVAGLAFLVLAVLVLAACDEQNTFVAPPPPKVTVAKPLIQDVTEYLEYTGRTAAVAHVKVPARVSGVLRSVEFEPGTPVNEGDLLFSIASEEYEARVRAAEAELARAEANKTEAEKTLKRAEALAARGNVSQAKLDEARAKALSTEAEVLVREANLAQAQLDLSYTQVTAPITGRVGRSLVDVGNLVGQGEATILTDITTFDPVYVYFEITERDLLRYLERNKDQADLEGRAGKRDHTELGVGLVTEQGYPHIGRTDFAESQVDASTGTLRVRGIVQNPGRAPVFLPGVFVRVRLPFDTRKDAPLVTERAIGFDQSGEYVLVVNSEDTVEKRNVDLGSLTDGLRVIIKGLSAGDRVVVNGLQRAREGLKVAPETVDMASLSASAIEARLAAEAASTSAATPAPAASGN